VPFTLAHPAAILPFRGVRLLRTAPLILGAMAPDLPYFLPKNLEKTLPETHEFSASFTTDLALGYLMLLAVFALRRPLTALLSPRARWLCLRALAPFRSNPSAWLLAALPILLGVWTHLLWDSFTHSDGWFVHRIAALSAPVTLGSYTGPMSHVLQYLSSAFGLVIMAIWYWRLPAPARVPATAGAPRSAVGPILVLVVAAAALIGGVQSTAHFHRTHFIYGALNILFTHSIAWFAALYLVAGIVITLEHEHGRVRTR
jgi:hypothetical protein